MLWSGEPLTSVRKREIIFKNNSVIFINYFSIVIMKAGKKKLSTKNYMLSEISFKIRVK